MIIKNEIQKNNIKPYANIIQETEVTSENNSDNNIKYKKTTRKINKIRELYTMKTGKNLYVQSGNDEFIENKFYTKFYTIELLNAFYSLITIMLSMTHNDLTYDKQKDINFIKAFDSMLYIITLFSLMLSINIILKYLLIINMLKEKGYMRKDEGLFSTYKWIKMLIEVLIFFPHPNILTKNKTYLSYNDVYDFYCTREINSIFSILVLFRFYYIYRFIVYVFNLMDPKTDQICKSHFFKTNFIFSLKVMFKRSPFFVYTSCGLIILICFAYSIRIFERELSTLSGQDWNLFWNAYWCVLITMLTVGYGDFSAKTLEGRIFAMAACILGSFLTSMMLISVANYLQLNTVERSAFTIFKKTEENEKINEMAKRLVIKYSELKYKNSNKKFSNFKMFTKIKEKESVELKELRSIADEFNRTTSSKNYNIISNPISSSVNSLIFLSKEYNDVKNKQVLLQNELKEIKDILKEIIIRN